jgi:DNA-binding GntR family transcriptional regulator
MATHAGDEDPRRSVGDDLADATSRQLVVTRVIAEDVASGRLQPGDRLESERALAERLGVSRVTVRNALRILAQDGLIVSAPGRGHFVAPSDFGEPPNRMMGFTELARLLGLAVSSRVVESQVRPATYDEARELRMVPGAPLLDVVRLRFLDGLPVVIDRTRLSQARVPGMDGLDFATASLFEHLGSVGLPPAKSDFEIQAVPAEPEHADLLDVDEGHPLLMITETGRLADGEPIYLGVATYRGERYRFRATVDREALR